MALALVFLALPALGYVSSQQMKAFLLRGQRASQAIAAQAIAAVLRGRYDLFQFHKGAVTPSAMDAVFYAYKAPAPIQVDGLADEWGQIKVVGARRFGAGSVLSMNGSAAAKSGGFSLAIARWERMAYLLMEVEDSTQFPAPAGKGPDQGDHVWIGLMDRFGTRQETIIPFEPSGRMTAWSRGAMDGQYSRDDAAAARMKVTSKGYTVELALREELIAEEMALKITMTDLSGKDSIISKTVIGPKDEGNAGFLRVGYPESPDIQSILDNLDFEGASVWVVDRMGRVRAASTRPGYPQSRAVYRRDDALTRRILEEGIAMTSMETGGPGEEMTLAGAPVKSPEGEILGGVILERSAAAALSMQEKAFENTVWTAMAGFLAVALGLALYATRLALRIHRLRQEAEMAIDHSGRVRVETLHAAADSGDEIGDLSRSISGLLKRLKRHHDFLAILPRTLKHEINNPLNTITVSLENLAEEIPKGATEKYIKSAGRGVARLKEMVDALAEAASVEDSIHQENFARVDLAALLTRYMENSAALDKNHIIRFSNAAGPANVLGSDFRLEQALDKLMDNAADFTPAGGVIEAELSRQGRWLTLAFRNDGPPIPEPMLGKIFDSLVSGREGGAGSRPHLGIGLYVVRVVAEAHGGGVEARNRGDGKGVEFIIRLPE